MTTRRGERWPTVLVAAACVPALACGDSTHLPEPAAGTGSSAAGTGVSSSAGSSAAAGASTSTAGSGAGSGAQPMTTALELLFLVDDSGSMREEQSSLRNGFPRLLASLTSGDVDLDGNREFQPAQSLHIGVVSSDLGLPSIQGIDKCFESGDAARLQNTPTADPEVLGCGTAYPAFLSYDAGGDAAKTGLDFGCIATLGTGGCGFEQQLEVMLKALWPAEDTSLQFLVDPTTMFGALGQGGLAGDNAGFVRDSAAGGLSAIALVLVSDEEDCSYTNSAFLQAPQLLDPTIPELAVLINQSLNLRCHFNPGELHPTTRYTDNLKRLRAGNERLVSFSAIVGVPPETVADVADEYWTLPSERAALYQRIRSHPMMQPVVDDLGTPDEPQDDNLVPSCMTPAGRAFPPRRIVDVAESFAQNGIVQSICQEDFGRAMDRVALTIGQSLGP